ncbi:MAG: M15 family metallopeptidase [Vicinamibacterales bacterium]
MSVHRPRALLAVALAVSVLAGAAGAQDQEPAWPREPEAPNALKPAPPPAEWNGLIGEYESAAGGPGARLYVIERDGRLMAIAGRGAAAPIAPAAFARDGGGRATRVTRGGVDYARLQVGPEGGAGQLRIRPVRPVAEILEEAKKASPPVETGDFRTADLVELTTLDPTIRLDIRYATTNNFLGSVFYAEARAFLQRPAAEAVARASKALAPLGYGLLVHDGYRPWYVTKAFWDATPADTKWLVANPASGSRHNRGAAVDITLYELGTGAVVQMPSTYDESTHRAYAFYPGGTSLERWHRALLRRVMEAEGFTVNPEEWWHFDHDDWRHYAIGNVAFDAVAGRGGAGR